MSTADELKAALSAVETAKEKLRQEHLAKLTDKSLSLDERWAIFLQLAEAGVLGHESYGDGYLDDLQGSHNELTQYDDFHNDRHETVSYKDMYERIVENPEDFEGCDIDAWREKVLEEGCATFDYDW